MYVCMYVSMYLLSRGNKTNFFVSLALAGFRMY